MRDAIVVEGVSKRFRRYRPNHPKSLQEALVNGLRALRPPEEFWALRDVSLTVPRGHMLGIVGPNGAGKSTLMQVIGGVIPPDKGKLEREKRIGALLDLGAGFHPDLTGRENLTLSGVIVGLTRREVLAKLDSIVAFAELEEFIDHPLRTYSTGMRMRLAFGVATHTNPQILLIDEVLAVGDLAFQRKCLDRIAEIKNEGCAIVLVSHEPQAVRQFCDEAIWLQGGQVAARGPADTVLDAYENAMFDETRRRTPRQSRTVSTSSGPLQIHENRFGSLDLEITHVDLLDCFANSTRDFRSGSALNVQVQYAASQSVPSPIFGVTITHEEGLICFDTNTAADGLPLSRVQGTGQVSIHIERLDLAPGNYFVDVGVYAHDWAYAYDYHWHVYPLRIEGTAAGKGIVHLKHSWRLDVPQPADPILCLESNEPPIVLIHADRIPFESNG